MSNSMFHTQFDSCNITISLTERALKWHFTKQGDQSSKIKMLKTVIIYSIDKMKGQFNVVKMYKMYGVMSRPSRWQSMAGGPLASRQWRGDPPAGRLLQQNFLVDLERKEDR